jgi:hypothetical protein
MKQRCKPAKNWFDSRKVVATYLDLMGWVASARIVADRP